MPSYIKYPSIIRDPKDNCKCGICPRVLSGVTSKLSCNHEFHPVCIIMWVNDRATPICPLCRKDITNGYGKKIKKRKTRKSKKRKTRKSIPKN